MFTLWLRGLGCHFLSLGGGEKKIVAMSINKNLRLILPNPAILIQSLDQRVTFQKKKGIKKKKEANLSIIKAILKRYFEYFVNQTKNNLRIC